MVAQGEHLEFEYAEEAREAALTVIDLKSKLVWRLGVPEDQLVDELVNDIWLAATSPTSPFDPALSSFPTFARRVVAGRLIDKGRRLKSFEDGKQKVRRGFETGELPSFDEGGDPDAKIGTFFSEGGSDREYVCIPRAKNRRRGGRLGYKLRPLVNALYEKGRSKMGWRPFYQKLLTHPDLAKDLGFDGRIPCLRTLMGLPRRMKKYRTYLRQSQAAHTSTD